MVTPLDASVSTFASVAGLSYMFASMVGQTITGAAVASTVALIGSSAKPSASFAIVCAVAGATITTLARSAMAT